MKRLQSGLQPPRVYLFSYKDAKIMAIMASESNGILHQHEQWPHGVVLIAEDPGG